MKIRIACTLLSLSAALAAATASAAVLEYQITTDQPATVTFFVDSSAPDLDPDPTIGKYAQPVSQAPPFLPSGNTFYNYSILRGPSDDRIQIEHGVIETVGPGNPLMLPPGNYVQKTVYEFIYPLGQFSSDAFRPIDFPGATSATQSYLLFDFVPGHTITSVTLVPEPASLGLLAISVMGLLACRRTGIRK